jgi:hypothetical protein
MLAVRAVVVGIEKYEAAWNLNGPARDAILFVEWLIGNGVRADRISLFISALAENQSAVDGCAVRARPAVSAEITREFTTVLLPADDDYLIVFWGGHGVIRADGSRHLLTADASENNLANIDLNSLLESLRSDLFIGFRSQSVLVDACANYFEYLRRTVSMPSYAFPKGGPAMGKEQFVLVSAKAGEVSKNLDAERTGLFSKELRAALATAGFPPDMKKVTQVLQEKFVEMRNRGEVRQTPIYFWSRDWAGNEDGLGKFEGRPTHCGSPAPQVSIQTRRRLVDALCTLPGLMRPNERDKVLEQISPSIVALIPRYDKPKFDIDSIVGTCLSFPDGICELMRTVRFFYEDLNSMGNLEIVFARLFPGECPPDV